MISKSDVQLQFSGQYPLNLHKLPVCPTAEQTNMQQCSECTRLECAAYFLTNRLPSQLHLFRSNMAAASLSLPGAPGFSLGFDDYSLYSNLSDDDLMQLAIERSLSDAHTAGSTPVVQNRANPPARQLNPPLPARQPNPPVAPQLCSHNPPGDVLTSYVSLPMKKNLSNTGIPYFLSLVAHSFSL